MARDKMAYVATISKLDPIEGKDRILYASLENLGWQCIVDASIKAGDKVVYCEIDSILPPAPEFEFLRKRCWSDKYQGYVIKGMKMSGLISYGLVLPISVLYGKCVPAELKGQVLKDGFDVTGLLQIRKKEDDENVLTGVKMIDAESKFRKWLNRWLRKLGVKTRKTQYIADGWLPFAHKTDETRIENIPYLFLDDHQGIPVYITEKADGASGTFAIYENLFYAASRNRVLYCKPVKKAIAELKPGKMYGDKYIDTACKYSLPKKMKTLMFKDVVIQGEIVGPGIQKNPMGLSENKMLVFNVFIPKKRAKLIATSGLGLVFTPEQAMPTTPIGSYLGWDAIADTAWKLGVPTVKLLDRTVWQWKDKASLKEYAAGNYENGKPREGIVIRYDIKDSKLQVLPPGERGMSNCWSLKCINDDYILGNK
jgi:hypothetical protein